MHSVDCFVWECGWLLDWCSSLSLKIVYISYQRYQDKNSLLLCYVSKDASITFKAVIKQIRLIPSYFAEKRSTTKQEMYVDLGTKSVILSEQFIFNWSTS